MVWNKKNDEPEVMVNTRIPESLYLRVCELARATNTSKYAVLRAAIKRGMEKYEKQ